MITLVDDPTDLPIPRAVPVTEWLEQQVCLLLSGDESAARTLDSARVPYVQVAQMARRLMVGRVR